jgi:YD repeat-containing protein
MTWRAALPASRRRVSPQSSYDALDRLHIYKSGTATQTYTYDANGNRASYVTNGTSPESLAYKLDRASNRLLGIGGSWRESFTYDAAGNMLSYSAPFGDYSFSYDARNRQAEDRRSDRHALADQRSRPARRAVCGTRSAVLVRL